MSCPHHESMTMEELAKEAYLEIGAGDDDRKDDQRLDHGMHLLGDLWDRLRPVTCDFEGCREPRMPSFPWCVAHRPPRRADQ